MLHKYVLHRIIAKSPVWYYRTLIIFNCPFYLTFLMPFRLLPAYDIFPYLPWSSAPLLSYLYWSSLLLFLQPCHHSLDSVLSLCMTLSQLITCSQVSVTPLQPVQLSFVKPFFPPLRGLPHLHLAQVSFCQPFRSFLRQ